MHVFDYMISEICETRRANKQLAKAFIAVTAYSGFALYSLTKQLEKEKEKVARLKKEVEEVYELCKNNEVNDIPEGE